MSNIIQHLKERMRQRELRQQITRSKSLTPILDAVNQAAKAEGISADEIVADFVSGKFEHPIVEAALGAPSEAQLDKMQRDSLAAKKQREEMLEATRRKHAEQRAKLKKPPVAIVKPAARPAAKVAAPATQSTRDKHLAEYAKITEPAQRRAYRMRWWNVLSGKIQAPEPRKSKP